MDQAEFTARLQAVYEHLMDQQTHNAPVTPWVLAELQALVAAMTAPPPDPPPEDTSANKSKSKSHAHA